MLKELEHFFFSVYNGILALPHHFALLNLMPIALSSILLRKVNSRVHGKLPFFSITSSGLRKILNQGNPKICRLKGVHIFDSKEAWRLRERGAVIQC